MSPIDKAIELIGERVKFLETALQKPTRGSDAWHKIRDKLEEAKKCLSLVLNAHEQSQKE